MSEPSCTFSHCFCGASQNANSGTTSEELASQVKHFSCPADERVLCVLHTGGNDVAQSLVDPCGLFFKTLVNLVLWRPCQFLIGLGLFVLGLATSTADNYAYGGTLQIEPWVLPVQIALVLVLLRAAILYVPPLRACFVVEALVENIRSAMEVLHREKGCRFFMVSGLPLHSTVPMIHVYLIPCRSCTTLLALFGAFSRSRIKEMLENFSRRHPDSRVTFFDEEAALAAVGQGPKVSPSNLTDSQRRRPEFRDCDDAGTHKTVDVEMPQLVEFWLDAIHPSDTGHRWLAKQAWIAWQNQQ